MSMADLFGTPSDPGLPPGLRYEPRLIPRDEAAGLVSVISDLPFEAFQFHRFTGKRRVVSFGWKYDFSAQRLEAIEPIPQFLLPLRSRAALFGGLSGDALEQVLVTEYQAGAAIGWHKDKAVYDEVIGISFGASCTMRFRRPQGRSWERRNVVLEPGSAYIITGESRSEWEHSIPPVEALRYSVTFRSLQKRRGPT
ncbi:MAG: alpha-ketoglutarate-dependent dioxygenase AlkB [Devosia sp.]|uniref:alpha-ketoglutarate-dependent dioxygenase AlkB n=1 Tax=Devosia sp. 66-22 TaxID=1895753 RepID=UPI0009267058|nr:alpha-ketoglutarate-dependent dioxygenase AlkB [Devosia sp. 66-22]MBN9347867.1 alpha-ketoglutarate-dependent dioxygenase AlkB [Devosia sp.]OJX50025.1 MAG: alpha-ketoglutarate-dependent dioxygenase AlkB [Devosia sp. 66-22]